MPGQNGIATFDVDWNRAPLRDLVPHIVAEHHGRFKVELPSLQGLLREVYASHRHRDSARLAPLPNLLFLLEDELDQHMRREELTIFPAIEARENSYKGRLRPALADRNISSLISAVLSEHDDILDRLAECRQMTDNYAVPSYADQGYRLLFQRLEALDHDLKFHIGVENDSVFSRALSLAQIP